MRLIKSKRLQLFVLTYELICLTAIAFVSFY